MFAKNIPNKEDADYRVSDIGFADWGRREIAIAQTEMPCLMLVREEYGAEWPYTSATYCY